MSFLAPNGSILVSFQNCNKRYDIYSLDGGEKRHDEAGLLEAVASIKKIVDEEVKAGIPLDRIVVGVRRTNPLSYMRI
jgi:hypothetical protein